VGDGLELKVDDQLGSGSKLVRSHLNKRQRMGGLTHTDGNNRAEKVLD